MKKLVILVAALFVSACAANEPRPSGFSGSMDRSNPLQLTLGASNIARITFEGKTYEGERESIQCTIDSCPDKYRILTKKHRAHSRGRSATLKAPDGSQLRCEWISHQTENEGVCIAPDGRKMALSSSN
ncbi:hypothetical protein [uncultured Propionivibrio sp.]|uniref:hypothetical protein n=1 Tax=uncultured Propionivibrio sp. TaxID=426737 RepID=UPI0029BFE2D6|nr:hypothetical protein [uncultured Propionivibrio sp.]